MLSVTVICYDSRAPVQHSFKAQSKLCPFVSAGLCAGVGVYRAGLEVDECRTVCAFPSQVESDSLFFK